MEQEERIIFDSALKFYRTFIGLELGDTMNLPKLTDEEIRNYFKTWILPIKTT